MTPVVLGCLVLGFGLYATLFHEHYLRQLRLRARGRWFSGIIESDLYSLLIWLGGVAFIVAGPILIYIGLTTG